MGSSSRDDLSEPVGDVLVEDTASLALLFTVVLDHAVVDTRILALDAEHGLGCLGLDDLGGVSMGREGRAVGELDNTLPPVPRCSSRLLT